MNPRPSHSATLRLHPTSSFTNLNSTVFPTCCFENASYIPAMFIL